MTKTQAQHEAARVLVVQWSMMLWLSQPDWLNRMPDERDTETLIKAIAHLLGQWNKP
jgi:hypothetical protein